MSNETLMKRLDGMDKKELITYANMTYGLNVNARMSKADLIQMIERSHSKFRGNAEVEVGNRTLKPGYARIKINKTELNKSGRPVIVGLNGTMYSLPVGHEFSCPMPLVEILNNAMQIQYDIDPSSNELVAREVHSYPFVILETSPSR